MTTAGTVSQFTYFIVVIRIFVLLVRAGAVITGMTCGAIRCQIGTLKIYILIVVAMTACAAKGAVISIGWC